LNARNSNVLHYVLQREENAFPGEEANYPSSQVGPVNDPNNLSYESSLQIKVKKAYIYFLSRLRVKYRFTAVSNVEKSTTFSTGSFIHRLTS